MARTQHKFKVGDRVRRVRDGNCGTVKLGHVYTIKELTHFTTSNNSFPFIKLYESDAECNEEAFDLVEEICYICGGRIDVINTDNNHEFFVYVKPPNIEYKQLVCLNCFMEVVNG